jgi:hypothetical protein
MTGEADFKQPVLPPRPAKTWTVTRSDGSARIVEAHGFRVEGGALVLLLPAGCVAAYAPGQWLTVETVSEDELVAKGKRNGGRRQ